MLQQLRQGFQIVMSIKLQLQGDESQEDRKFESKF